MIPYYQHKATTIYLGDCLDVLPTLEGSVDSVVTDPPYGWKFMGKKWDYEIPSVKVWEECLRVLKPGGHILVCCGTRTQHRMAVNIEDAGFEIRDLIAWVYGAGFPKSLDIFKQLKKQCTCGIMEAYEQRAKALSQHSMRPLWETDISEAKYIGEEQGEVLQSGLSQQGLYRTMQGGESQEGITLRQESSLEGRDNAKESEGQLRRREVCAMPEGISTDGEGRWLCNGTSPDNGSASRQTPKTHRGSTSQRPQSKQQLNREPCAFCQQWGAQALRTYGEGTALKPAWECWTLARKPISEKTIPANVLKYGTGGLNIDGCRVETKDNLNGGLYSGDYREQTSGAWQNQDRSDGKGSGFRRGVGEYQQPIGRFPANLIHDGSEEVVRLFPETQSGGYQKGSRMVTRGSKGKDIGRIYGAYGGTNHDSFSVDDGNGSAARFFYCAKADKEERNVGLEGFPLKDRPGIYDDDNYEWKQAQGHVRARPSHNNHPTVKPVSLMRYLCRLITPPNGIVLDPFMGSGSTGIACKLENFGFIGIEIDEDYCKIASRRFPQEVMNLVETD